MTSPRALLLIACTAIATCSTLLLQSAPAQTAPSATTKPTLYLIGDSTVRNGSWDNGATAGQWGWGHILHYYFDTSKINIVNDAMGGTSSRSYQESPTLWTLVIPKIQKGDYVMMQFGHNDSAGSLRGNGDETGTLGRAGGGGPPGRAGATATGPSTSTAPARGPGAGAGAPVHSFGWYMRQYIIQIRDKGATPIVCSLIPRNRWTDGKVGRNTNDYALWAKQAAEQEHALFIPLNDLIADGYDKLGQAKVVADFFPPNEAVHPNWAGAKFNAERVLDGLRTLKDCPLKDYLLADPHPPETPDITAPARGELGPAGGARGPARGRGPTTTTTPATATAN